MGFSMVWVIDLLIHLVYKAAGLRPHTVALDDDTTVHCWISSSLLPPSSAIRSKEKKATPPLLLIHGFGPRGTWQWSRQIWHLAARFDLVVPDLLFFGGSTTRSPIRSEAFQAAAIARLLAVLGVGPPHRARVSVAGTSYGGFVAYHVARALGPEWVERVVIASSDVLKGPDDDRALLERAGGARSIDELLLPRTTADLRRLARLAVYRPPLFVPEFILRDMLQNLFSDNLEEKLELIKGVTVANKEQVLIIWGEHDQIFPVAKAIELQKRLGENARLEVLQNTGHLPQMEDANRFNKLLFSFLLGASQPSLSNRVRD
nr:PREDICTED: uncharacterized protein LOC103973465 isoform X2 [Musa acuminata subsp. malaccensis]